MRTRIPAEPCRFSIHLSDFCRLDPALIPAMAELGERYTRGEYYVPEMLISARAMKAAVAALQSYLVQAKVEPLGRTVIGTVKGDLQDIGKNLVGLMLQCDIAKVRSDTFGRLTRPVMGRSTDGKQPAQNRV